MTRNKPRVFEHLFESPDPQRERRYNGLHSNLLERIAELERANRVLAGQLELERRNSEDLRKLLAQAFTSRPSGR